MSLDADEWRWRAEWFGLDITRIKLEITMQERYAVARAIVARKQSDSQGSSAVRGAAADSEAVCDAAPGRKAVQDRLVSGNAYV
eukprot:IDg1718t1